jgi:hypothetical protein
MRGDPTSRPNTGKDDPRSLFCPGKFLGYLVVPPVEPEQSEAVFEGQGRVRLVVRAPVMDRAEYPALDIVDP